MKIKINKVQLLLAFHTVLIFLISFSGNQENFSLSFFLVTAAFILYLVSYQFSYSLNLKDILVWTLITRIVTLPFLPALSEDYLRFFFDSFLLNAGQNPYLILPSQYLQNEGQEALYNLVSTMNSPDYFTVYPPVSQFLFGAVFWASSGSLSLFVLFSKIIFILFDLGSVYLIYHLLRLIRSPVRYTSLFAFNPLLILELTGQLHTEGVAIFFTLMALYLLLKHRWIYASIVLGTGISVKLLPVLFLPFFIKYLGWKKGISAGLVSMLIFLFTFLPFLSYDVLMHFGDSLDLYFRNFEFNAYIYFILRDILSYFIGYNPISYLGPALAIVSGISMVLLSIYYIQTLEIREFMSKIVLLYLVYFALATTIHPWYVSWIVVFSIFHKRNHLLLSWSYLVILSYFFYANGIQTGWWWWSEYILLTFILISVLLTRGKSTRRPTIKKLPRDI